MKYGQVAYGRAAGGRGWFVVEAPPHILLRLKRVFERVRKDTYGRVGLSDTPENARELGWFLQRYPMEVTEDARAAIDAGDAMHREREASIAAALSVDYVPRVFDLAEPARDYQRLAADLALRVPGLLLADDVGTGKTVSAICALVDPKARPALVVTLTHLPSQWVRELARFAPGLRVQVLRGTRPYDLTKGPRGRSVAFPDVIVTSYSKLGGWAETLAPLVRGVVFDEVQELRHRESAKYNAAAHLAAGAVMRLGLSATPIYNYGGEIFSVLDVLAPGALGTAEEFGREWCRSAAHSEKARVAEPRVFGAWLREQGLMLRRTRKQVGRELPALSRVTQTVDADLRALEVVAPRATELAKLLLARGGVAPADRMRAAEELSWRLRQATGLAKAGFVAAFVRLLVESGEKVVLFGWHHEVYDVWREQLADLSPVFFTGAESTPQKDAARKAFVEGDAKVLVMSLRAGAGLDGLQNVSRTVVFGELDWSPGVHEQCVGRIYRDGQGEPVVAYFLVAEVGSDPIVASVLGLKRNQSEGLRDPEGALVEDLTVDAGHIRRLAEGYLAARGEHVAATALESDG